MATKKIFSIKSKKSLLWSDLTRETEMVKLFN